MPAENISEGGVGESPNASEQPDPPAKPAALPSSNGMPPQPTALAPTTLNGNDGNPVGGNGDNAAPVGANDPFPFSGVNYPNSPPQPATPEPRDTPSPTPSQAEQVCKEVETSHWLLRQASLSGPLFLHGGAEPPHSQRAKEAVDLDISDSSTTGDDDGDDDDKE